MLAACTVRRGGTACIHATCSGWQCDVRFSGTADDVLSGSPLASRQPSSFHSFSSIGGSNFGGRSASGAADVAEEMRRLRVEDFAEGPSSSHPSLSVQVAAALCVVGCGNKMRLVKALSGACRVTACPALPFELKANMQC
jgi:hypothetical protein